MWYEKIMESFSAWLKGLADSFNQMEGSTLSRLIQIMYENSGYYVGRAFVILGILCMIHMFTVPKVSMRRQESRRNATMFLLFGTIAIMTTHYYGHVAGFIAVVAAPIFSGIGILWGHFKIYKNTVNKML